MNYLVRSVLFACLGMAVLIACTNWGLHEDLYMSICAGRDVWNNDFRQPDTWSFLTGGRVWINQGWLSHLTLYLSWLLLEETGPLATRATLLISSLAVVMYSSLKWGMSFEAILPALTMGTLVISPFVSIRAENFALFSFVLLIMFLTAPRSWSSWRFVGSLSAVLLWANFHGTFLLGCAMLGIRTFIAFLETRISMRIPEMVASTDSGSDTVESSDRSDGLRQGRSHLFDVTKRLVAGSAAGRSSEAWKWALTTITSIALVAVANPYGVKNLTMLFHQVTSERWHRTVGIWQPLISSWTEMRLYGDTLIVPFVVTTLFILLSLGAAVWSGYLGKCFVPSSPSEFRERGWLLLTYVAIWIASVCVSIRFGRGVLFAGMALIPVMAFVLQFWMDSLGTLPRAEPAPIRMPLLNWTPLLLSVLFLAAISALLRSQTITPLAPSNPMVAEASISKRIIGPLSTNTGQLIDFMRNNGVRGRIFSNWALADVLLFYVPSIKIFVDCRAQSIYSDADLQDYHGIIGVKPQDTASALNALDLLDKYRVSHVVLANNGVENPSFLADMLLRSNRWAPMYVDPLRRGFVFVKRNANQPPDTDVCSPGQDSAFWFPQPDSGAVSRTFLALNCGRPVSPGLLNQLYEIVAERPGRLTYRAIADCARKSNGCFSERTSAFLHSELQRLSHMNMLSPGLGYALLQSRLEIIYLLEEESQACHPAMTGLDYGKRKSSILKAMHQMRADFLPCGFDSWQWP